MPIQRAANFLEAYRHLAISGDLHALSGRSTHREFTAAANQAIRDRVGPVQGLEVLDVGCGDGSLVRQLAEAGALAAVGVAPSEEEVLRLTRERGGSPGPRFVRAALPVLPFDHASFDVVVSNGVLILLDDRDAARESLAELARVARPGGKVWVGELPDSDEITADQRTYGDSIARWLWHVFRRDGIRAFVRAARRVLAALLGKETMVIFPKRCLFVPPAEFLEEANRAGLVAVWHGKHLQPGREGVLVESPTRYDYLFEKAASPPSPSPNTPPTPG